MLTGAGADRLQQGMKKAFGKIIGRAARVHKDDIIISVKCLPEHYRYVRESLKVIKHKFPRKSYIDVLEGEEFIPK